MANPLLLFHNQGKGQPIGGVIGVPTWDFDPALMTFTAKMAKRTAPGPFAAAPIVQGKWDAVTVGDVLNFGRGTQVSGNFYPSIDTAQGSIVFWWTPEKSTASGDQEYLFYINSNYLMRHEPASSVIRVKFGTQTFNPSVTVVAGNLYCIVLRWDCDNKLDGTNYACLSINDSHEFGLTSLLTASAPNAALNIGQAWDFKPANAIIEGLTIVRRVLWDGTYGVDAGVGDEIALISAGVKPEEIIGAADICFQLPTDGSTGELATGTGEAWSWPWADNELLNWHMQDDTAGAPDNWTAYNSPTLADAETANILFGTRSQKVSVDGQFEGIYQDISVSAGEDYCISAWVKDNGANQGVLIEAYDQTGSALIVAVNSTDSGAWENLTTCFEIPAGCSTVRISIISLDNDTYDFYIAQVQVLPNLVDNGGMEGVYDDESGGGGGTLDVAPGWNNRRCESDGSDELSREAGIFHSGLYSQKVVADSTEGIESASSPFSTGKWHLITMWLYGDGSDLVNIIDNQETIIDETVTPPAAWTRYSFVGWAQYGNELLRIVSSTGHGTFYIDDVSIVVLDDVSITVTPANEANSTEDGGIRVDGLDACTVDITGKLGAKSGKVRFKWTPRHGDGDFNKFTEGTVLQNLSIASIYKDNNNYIAFAQDSNTQLICTMNCVAGGAEADTWVATGITAGTTYLIEIEYNSTTCTVSFDGTIQMTITYTGGIDFGANIPDAAYMGGNATGVRISDAVFSAP